ncbi:hypothetical protein NPIL_552001 [Nephila pilipes]|uniref:Uncharacterized protein n=1 Tax=Nephila pilipes TaxID=299642 RepID=A0A8X6N4U6_NEPPI|nr:hypothetical protein NPIL_552001 [Nephila pilipes]
MKATQVYSQTTNTPNELQTNLQKKRLQPKGSKFSQLDAIDKEPILSITHLNTSLSILSRVTDPFNYSDHFSLTVERGNLL